jgi:hypothetical protein
MSGDTTKTTTTALNYRLSIDYTHSTQHKQLAIYRIKRFPQLIGNKLNEKKRNKKR